MLTLTPFLESVDSEKNMNAITQISVTVPIRIVSEMNARDHWRKRHARFKQQKLAVFYVLHPFRDELKAMAESGERIRVTLTKIGRMRFDTDNLAAGFKSCRDQVASLLGIDDGSERITWIYQQRGSAQYAAEIAIELKGE